MNECIFCKMAHGDIPVAKIFEDADFFCIRDIHPQANVHLLVIAKKHVRSLAAAFPEDAKENALWVGRILEVGTRVARQEGLLPQGFRSVINTEKHGGQTVFHLHMHLLGGEELRGSFN
jgi:histidine triad (HIT) family protein